MKISVVVGNQKVRRKEGRERGEGGAMHSNTV